MANQNRRKLGVFDRKLEGSHPLLQCFSYIYILEKENQECYIDVFFVY